MIKFILFVILLVIIGGIGSIISNKIEGILGKNKKENSYSKKSLMTKYERFFYDILIELKDELNIEIMPQVNLASIINKDNNNYYRNELFRNIDFGIFTKDYKELILLIEINDKTHNTKNRKSRDIKVDNIVKSAGVNLIKFYSNYPNKKDYVIDRIKNEIKNITMK